jgi:iron-sulfur cluster assembly protein
MGIKLTDKAVAELKSLMKKEIEAERLPRDASLRLMVVGGGCSGFSYKMGFDTRVHDDDQVEDIQGIKVVVDGKSLLYLESCEVDFQDGLMGRGFVFNNPNASGSCGCGSSFSV